MSTQRNIDVDEAEVINLLRRDTERRLRELASKYVEGALEVPETGKVSDTVLSPGLKLSLKDDIGSWDEGSLWVVADPAAHPAGRRVPVTADQVLLVHDTGDGQLEDMVVLKSELDDKFELR